MLKDVFHAGNYKSVNNIQTEVLKEVILRGPSTQNKPKWSMGQGNNPKCMSMLEMNNTRQITVFASTAPLV